jgi:hypothetical protein
MITNTTDSGSMDLPGYSVHCTDITRLSAPDPLSNRIANGKCIKQNDDQYDRRHHAVKHTRFDETQEYTSES